MEAKVYTFSQFQSNDVQINFTQAEGEINPYTSHVFRQLPKYPTIGNLLLLSSFASSPICSMRSKKSVYFLLFY